MGVGLLPTWQVSAAWAAAWALAVMFLFTTSAHLTKTREDLIGMVSKAFPNPRFLVHLNGVLEVLGAVGLLVPATRSVAGLALLPVAMFTANANASRKEVELRGKASTPL